MTTHLFVSRQRANNLVYTCNELPTLFAGGTGDRKPAIDVTFARDERRFFFGSFKHQIHRDRETTDFYSHHSLCQQIPWHSEPRPLVTIQPELTVLLALTTKCQKISRVLSERSARLGAWTVGKSDTGHVELWTLIDFSMDLLSTYPDEEYMA